MRSASTFKRLFAMLLFFSAAQMAFSQGLKDVFTNSGSPLVYLGIDFTKARLLDNGNPDAIKGYLYNSINQVVINEPKKYDLNGAFEKSNIDHDLSAVTAGNEKINSNDIISTNSADFNRLTESDIAAVVKALDLSGKKGVGLLFVMEAMRKVDKKGEAAIWVTLVDMGTKKVLLTERIVSNPASGIGFRNYWASTIKSVIDTIRKKKYNEWKAKYGK